MIESAANGMDHNQRPKRWMLKYMAFGAIILKYRKQLDMSCVRVISLGDGREEEYAVREYATEHKVECIHFGFLKYPTIEQLQEQWCILEETFAKWIHPETKAKESKDRYFTLHGMLSVAKCKTDNNRHFSGKLQQLPALNAYLNFWIKESADEMASLSKMESVCETIRTRLANVDGSRESALKVIVHYLANQNELFLKTWVAAYRR